MCVIHSAASVHNTRIIKLHFLNLKQSLLFLMKFHAILDSIEVSIPACHAGDPGSIPGRGDKFFVQI